MASHLVPVHPDVLESSFQERLRGAPLRFEDQARKPPQLFAGVRELGDSRAQRLGIAELEVYPGEHSQALHGGHGRTPTHGPAKGDELLAEREPLGSLCRRFQGSSHGQRALRSVSARRRRRAPAEPLGRRAPRASRPWS